MLLRSLLARQQKENEGEKGGKWRRKGVGGGQNKVKGRRRRKRRLG